MWWYFKCQTKVFSLKRERNRNYQKRTSPRSHHHHYQPNCIHAFVSCSHGSIVLLNARPFTFLLFHFTPRSALSAPYISKHSLPTGSLPLDAATRLSMAYKHAATAPILKHRQPPWIHLFLHSPSICFLFCSKTPWSPFSPCHFISSHSLLKWSPIRLPQLTHHAH